MQESRLVIPLPLRGFLRPQGMHARSGIDVGMGLRQRHGLLAADEVLVARMAQTSAWRARTSNASALPASCLEWK